MIWQEYTWFTIGIIFVVFSIYCACSGVQVNPILRYANKKFPEVDLNAGGRAGVKILPMLVPILLIYPTYVLTYYIAKKCS